MASIVVVERLFEDQRLPESKLVFERRFEGVFCVAISPEYPAAPIDPEGFAVYTFDGRGIARSGTFPAGKGAINRAVSIDRHTNTTHLLADSWSACGSFSFGDRAIGLGVVGRADCPKYDAARTQSFDETLALYCK